MANRLSRAVPLAELKVSARAPTGLPALPDAGAEALTASIKAFSGLSDYLNRWADKAAEREATEAGITAALEQGDAVRLRRDGTLAGEAFDAAVVDTRAAMLDTAMRNDIFAVAESFRGDPEGMARKLDELRAAYATRAGLTPALTRHLLTRFDALRFPYEKEAIRARDAKVREEAIAAYGTAIDTALRDAARTAYTLGGDPEGDDKIAAEATRIKQMVSRAQEAGYISPANAAKIAYSVDHDLATQKIAGAFDRLQGPDAKAEFLRQLEKDYRAGKVLKGIDPGDFGKLVNTLSGNLRREVSVLNQEARLLKIGVDSIYRRALEGYGVSAQEWAELDAAAKRVNSPELQASLAAAKQSAAMIDTWWSMRPAELAAAIAAEKTRIRSLTSPAERETAAARVADAERVYAAMNKQAERDPLALAERTGRVAPTTLDPGMLQATPELAAEQFAKRRAAAEQAAESLGLTTPRYFTEDERRQWAAVFNKGGDAAVAAATLFAQQWGGDVALRAIAEVAPQASAMGHAALVKAVGGSDTFVRDVARALAYAQMPGYEPTKLKPTAVRTAAAEEYGPAFLAAPAAEARALEAAKAAFDARSRDQRLPADIDTGDARTAFRRTLQEAAGATFEGGEQYGGVAVIHGRKTLIPSDVKASRAEDVIDAITDADLAANPPIAANGKPLRARDLRSAALVAIARGKYRVAAGEPESDRPQWFADKDGNPWVLDLEALLPTLRNRRPELFRGGAPPRPAADAPDSRWYDVMGMFR